MDEEKKLIEPLAVEEVETALGKGKRKPYKSYKDKKVKKKTGTEEDPTGGEKHVMTQKRLRALEKARVKLAEKREMERKKKEEIHKTPVEPMKMESRKHVEVVEHVSNAHALDLVHPMSAPAPKNRPNVRTWM